MRPLSEIIAWRSHAAWATDAQVEQDLILTMVMLDIFKDPFLSAYLAMRGGTVLHKMHLAPASRYSEDIDLVLIGEHRIGDIERGLRRVLAPLLGKPVQSIATTVTLALRNRFQPSKIIRLVYNYRPTVAPPSAMKVKVEVNYSETKPCYPLVGLPYRPPLAGLPSPVTIRSYDLDEMLGTKMRALIQRSHGRDLFDLDRACLQREAGKGPGSPLFDPDRVVAAFATYMKNEGSRVTRQEYEADLREKCAAPSFRRDMERVLPPGVRFNVDEAQERVRAVLISRIGDELPLL